jgi:hypothetical protein
VQARAEQLNVAAGGIFWPNYPAPFSKCPSLLWRGAMMAYEACILLAKIACAGVGYPTGRNFRLKKYGGDAATHRPIAI